MSAQAFGPPGFLLAAHAARENAQQGRPSGVSLKRNEADAGGDGVPLVTRRLPAAHHHGTHPRWRSRALLFLAPLMALLTHCHALTIRSFSPEHPGSLPGTESGSGRASKGARNCILKVWGKQVREKLAPHSEVVPNKGEKINKKPRK